MLEARTGVVALADVSKVIDKRLYARIVFVVDVHHFLVAEFTRFAAWVGAALFLTFWHKNKGN